jgi:copper(I)-binding protein
MIRKPVLWTILLTLLALLLNNCAADQTGIMIEAAWARPAAEGSNSAVYLRITNLDPEDAWIGVTSPQAAVSELHRSIIQADGTARMEPQAQIDLPQNETIELVAGGLHVMLIDLEQTLEPGDTLKLILVFSRHEKVEIDVPVKTP